MEFSSINRFKAGQHLFKSVTYRFGGKI